MTAGELAVLMAAVLCSIGFAALVVVLMRVLDALRELRREVSDLRSETRPLLNELRITTVEARETVDEARSDLERFDRVLGSAEAIGDAVGAHVAKTAYSTPMIKFAGLAKGTVAHVRPPPRQLAEQCGRAPKSGGTERRHPGARHRRGTTHRDRSIRERRDTTTKETTSMMKRITWFVGGAAAGAAGAGYATKKVKQTAAQISPSQVARSAASKARLKSRDVVDAVREGRLVARHHEDELRAKREGRLESLADHVEPGDQVFVDGVPVESGSRHRDASPGPTTPLSRRC